MKSLLLFSALLLFSITTNAQNWKDVGAFGMFPDAVSGHLTVTGSGTPYIAYLDFDGNIMVQEWNGSQWNSFPISTFGTIEDLRITSSGEEVFIGFSEESFFKVYQKNGTAWNNLGDLTSVSYLQGQIDLNASGTSGDNLQLFYKDFSSGNGTVLTWGSSSGAWTIIGMPDFLTTPDIGEYLSPFVKNNGLNTFSLVEENDGAVKKLRLYSNDGGSMWNNLLKAGTDDFIIENPIAYIMDVVNGEEPKIALVSTDIATDIQIYVPNSGTNSLTREVNFTASDKIVPNKLAMAVASGDDIFVIYQMETGAPIAMMYDGTSWTQLGANFAEMDLEEFKMDMNLLSNKPYFLYKSASTGAIGVKTYNNVPQLDAAPTLQDMCNNGTSQTIIPSIQFNDFDNDSVYLAIESSDPTLIDPSNVQVSRLSAFSPTSTVNNFSLNALASGAGSVDITVYAIDGLDSLAQVYTFQVNSVSAFSFSVSDPTTCSGTNGSLNITGLNFEATYDITYEVNGSPIALSSVVPDGSGDYSISGLSSGNYGNITVTDVSTGCSFTNSTVEIMKDPELPAFSIDQTQNTNPNTCGGSDGSFEIYPDIGLITPKVTYDLNGNTFEKVVTEGGSGYYYVTGLSAGTYTNIILTDQTTDCSATERPTSSIIELVDPTAPTFSVLSVNETNFCTYNDGSIVLGGLNMGQQYNVGYKLLGTGTVNLGVLMADNTAAAELIINNLAPGVYDSIFVQDLNTSCKGYEAMNNSYAIVDPSAPVFTIPTIINPSLCGENNGSITLEIQGVTAPTMFSSLSYDLDGTSFSSSAVASDAMGNLVIESLTAGVINNIILTDAAGCIGVSSGQVVLTEPTRPSVAAGSDMTICEGESILLTADNPTGAEISWDNGIENGENFSRNAGSYTFTVTASSGLCSITDNVAIEVFEKPILELTTTPASCGEKNAAINTLITGGTPPYDVYWSNGERVENITNLPPKIHYLNVFDANNCFSMAAGNIELASLSVSGTLTDNTCFGQLNGAISLTVSGTGPFKYYWSNGARTKDLNNLSAGQYEVFVTDASDCSSSASFIIGQPSIITTTFNKTLSTCAIADGQLVASASGGTAPLTFNWQNSAGTDIGTNDPTLPLILADQYALLITDANGCSKTFDAALSDVDGPSIIVESILAASCADDGSINLTARSTSSTIASLNWSSGETVEDISSKKAGVYVLSAIDAADCKTIRKFNIPVAKPEIQNICIVTVDTATNTNRIVWEKPITTEIDHYDIYRESSIAGMFQYVNSQDYNSESFFVDSIAYPQLRSWRYKMVAVNNCGIESRKSIAHKTMHIVFNETTPGTFQIDWDAYEGFAYSNYKIWRYLPTEGWELIATQSTSLPTTLTNTPPSKEDVDYIVEVELTTSCTSTAKATDYNSSRSNRTKHNPISAGDDVPKEEVDDLSVTNLSSAIKIYPNPFETFITVSSNGSALLQSIQIFDLTGKLIYSSFKISNQHIIELSRFDSGVYVVQILSDNGTSIQKIVKQ